MTTDDLYQFMMRLTRKNQGSGISATEFNTFWNDAQASYMDDLVGRFQNLMHKGMSVGPNSSEVVLTKLEPFIKTVNIVLAGGQAPAPADYLYAMAVRSGGYKCVQVDYNQIASMTDDVIDPPSISDNSYYYTKYGKTFNVFPALTPSIDLDYISVQPPVKWAYTYDTNNRQVYDSGNSSQPLWDNNSCYEITKRTLKTLGVSFQEREFEQFGQTVINNGE